MWPNTPDILHEYLQQGGRPAFEARLVLAATLSPSYGIYSGYEACENGASCVPGQRGVPRLGEVRGQAAALGGPLLPLIRRLNEIRRAHPALQRFEILHWLATQNDDLIAFAKREGDDVVIVVVNLDPAAVNEGLCIVPAALGLPAAFAAHDLLNDATYGWRTGRNYVKLPAGGAHIMVIDG